MNRNLKSFNRSIECDQLLCNRLITKEIASASYPPLNAEYVTLAANASLPNERILTAGTAVSLIDGGAGNPITINSTGTNITLASAGGVETLVSDGTGPTLAVKGLTAGTATTIVDGGTFLTVNSTGTNITLASAGGVETLVNDGTGPTLAVKGLTDGLGMQMITNATNITIGMKAGTTANNMLRWTGADWTETSTVQVDDASSTVNIRNPAKLAFQELTANGNNFVSLRAPDALAGDLNFILPTVDGGAGDVLQTSGGGVLSFVTIQLNNAGGGSTLVNDGTGPVLAIKSITASSNLTITSTATNIDVKITDGTVSSSLMRWNGAAWAEETNVLITAGGSINVLNGAITVGETTDTDAKAISLESLNANESYQWSYGGSANWRIRCAGATKKLDFDDVVNGTTFLSSDLNAGAPKIGFLGKTPIVKPTTGSTTDGAFDAKTSGIVNGSAEYRGYTVGKIVDALQQLGLLT